MKTHTILFSNPLPKKHSIRFSTKETVDGMTISDIYVPNVILQKLEWQPGKPIALTYSVD